MQRIKTTKVCLTHTRTIVFQTLVHFKMKILNTSEDILKNVDDQSWWIPLTSMAGEKILWNSMGYNCLFTNILQNIFFF